MRAGSRACGEQEVRVVVPAAAVLTNGQFIPADGAAEGQREEYRCIDTVAGGADTVPGAADSMVAVICLAAGCRGDFCVSKCCPR